MPIDASIALGVQQPNILKPAELIQLRNLQRQGQLQELQLAEQTRQVQNRNRLLDLTSDPANLDPQTGTLKPEAITKVMAFDPAMGQEQTQQRNVALSSLSVQRMRDMQVQQQKVKAHKDAASVFVNAYDEALGRTGGNTEEAQRAALKARNEFIEGNAKGGLYSTMGITDAEIQQSLGEPGNIDQYRAQVETPEQRRQRTAPQSTLGKLEADFKAGRISPADYTKAKERATSPTAIMLAGDAVPSEEALTMAADQYLAGDTSAGQGYARNAKAKKAFVEALTKRAQEKGMTGADVAAKVAEFQGIKAGQRSLGTRQAQVDMAVTEAQNVIPIALAESAKVSRTKYPTLNSILLAAEKGTGDEGVVRFAAATNALINIYSRAISPTGTPTVSDKDHAREIISKAYSQGQFAAVVDLMKQEMGAAKASPAAVREDLSRATSGRDAGDLKSKVENSGWSYEPDKYEYRVGPSGQVQRRKKGG